MKLNDSIPKISSIAILLVVLYLLNAFGGPLLTPYFTAIFNSEEYYQYTNAVKTASIIDIGLSSVLNIVLSIWIFKQAKKQDEKPIVWTVFTLFFGLTAIVLFYLFLLIKEIKKLNEKLDNT